MSLREKIYKAGVVGAGGAGFPTHIKYNGEAEHLIINAAECEPLLFTDQYQMQNRAKEIIGGIKLGQEYLKCEKTTIAIKGEFTESIAALEEEIKNQNIEVHIHRMKTFYPAGDEHTVISEVTGTPLAPGGIPIQIGIVVSNVATMMNIYEAEQDKPVTRKVVTISGEINNPMILEVPVGITVDECVQIAGGSSVDDYHIIFGGPMMGKTLTREASKTEVITKTSGGILLFESGHPLITRRLKPIERIRNETSAACISCTFCTELCPRYLKGHPLRPHEVMVAFGQDDPNHPHLEQADLCCECGICELYSCPMGLSPRIVNAYVRAENSKKKDRERPVWVQEEPRDAAEFRDLPTKRLNMKIEIDEYAKRKIDDFEVKKIYVDRVSIPLSQHIGMPSKPVVSVGDKVEAGDIIGEVGFDQMGANVHASISGIVKSIDDEIVIEGE